MCLFVYNEIRLPKPSRPKALVASHAECARGGATAPPEDAERGPPALPARACMNCICYIIIWRFPKIVVPLNNSF